jgi:hypothetical protein
VLQVHLVILDFDLKKRTEQFFFLAFVHFVLELKRIRFNRYIQNAVIFIAVNKLNVVVIFQKFVFSRWFQLHFPERVLVCLYFAWNEVRFEVRVEILELRKKAPIELTVNGHSPWPSV